MSNQTFAERCQLAQQCLPDAPYRVMLTALHAEMLSALAEQPAPVEPVAWCSQCGHKCPQPAPVQQEPVACLSETQARAIFDLALDLEKTGRLVAITEGQERTDFVARNRSIQCALEDALRNATAPQPAPVQQEPDWLDKEQTETDWDQVWLLIKATSYASSKGFISGTTNWGSAVSRYMRNESPQPAQRPWVGLTDEDKHEIELRAGITEDDDGYIVSQVFRLTEAKLKEKSMSKEAIRQALEAFATDLEQGRQVWIPATTLRKAAAALAEQPAQQEPVAWKHDCAALLTNNVELWIGRCPHCGKPRPPAQPAQQQEPVAGVWEMFAAYLIDKCEGEIITEEGLQRSLADMLADPNYATPQPAQQEPVAWWIPKAEQFCIADPSGRPFAKAWEPLYTSPPAQRKPLTDEQIERIYDRYGGNMTNCARAIERALNIKE